jgi:large subunit ribosomal protein L25
MTTETVILELDPRNILGKKVKSLRREGIIPVHLYGQGVESRALQCHGPMLIQVLSRAGGNTPITITIRGEEGSQLAFAREIQWDPRRDSLNHVDFLVAEATRLVSAQVPIILIGESSGARSSGGTVMQQLRTVDVEALPLEMPAQIEIDLAVLTEAAGVIRAGDLAFTSNVNLLTDPDEVVVRIEAARVEVEVAAEEVEAEEGEESEPAPGEDRT